MSTPPPPMRHRSFYLAAADADRLAELVDDVHHSLRRPKHQVLAAAVAVAADHKDEILARLTAGGER